MKIALLYLDALRSGGYPRDVRWLGSALARQGHEVSLVARTGREDDGLEGVEIIPPRGFPSHCRNIDLVHSWGLFVPAQVALETLARKRRPVAPAVVSPLAQLMPLHLGRSLWKKVPYLTLLRPTLRGSGPVVHFFSEEEYWSSLHYLQPKAHFEATLGLYPVTATAHSDVTRDYVLFLGRNDISQKGLDVLVEGHRHALRRGNEMLLVVAGHSEKGSAAYWRKVASDPELSPFIELVGEVSEERRGSLLAGARCLVFPSRWDGPPRPVREAIAVGTPVIVTNGTNMGKLVESQGAGCLVALDPSSIADGLLQAADPDTLSRWREGATQLRDRLTWDRVASDYIDGYKLTLAI